LPTKEILPKHCFKLSTTQKIVWFGPNISSVTCHTTYSDLFMMSQSENAAPNKHGQWLILCARSC